jgi:phosphohistidine phosphatase SixA
LTRRLRVALAGAALAALAAVAAAQPALEGPALVAALRGGGYVLYLRHASTDFSKNDVGMTSFTDCANQRNLTDAGRAEARAIGAAVTRLRIPVGPVLASPYCRTTETARLVFGSATVSDAARGDVAESTDPNRYAGLRALLSTPVAKGSNLAIASHGNPFYALAGPPRLAEGEMAVIEPLGNGRFRIVARITKDAWADLQ